MQLSGSPTMVGNGHDIYICIVINVVIYFHYSMVTALGSIVIQEFIFRNKILLLLLLLEPCFDSVWVAVAGRQRNCQDQDLLFSFFPVWTPGLRFDFPNLQYKLNTQNLDLKCKDSSGRGGFQEDPYFLKIRIIPNVNRKFQHATSGMLWN